MNCEVWSKWEHMNVALYVAGCATTIIIRCFIMQWNIVSLSNLVNILNFLIGRLLTTWRQQQSTKSSETNVTAASLTKWQNYSIKSFAKCKQFGWFGSSFPDDGISFFPLARLHFSSTFFTRDRSLARLISYYTAFCVCRSASIFVISYIIAWHIDSYFIYNKWTL